MTPDDEPRLLYAEQAVISNAFSIEIVDGQPIQVYIPRTPPGTPPPENELGPDMRFFTVQTPPGSPPPEPCCSSSSSEPTSSSSKTSPEAINDGGSKVGLPTFKGRRDELLAPEPCCSSSSSEPTSSSSKTSPEAINDGGSNVGLPTFKGRRDELLAPEPCCSSSSSMPTSSSSETSPKAINDGGRKVELPTFKSRRAELLAANKPVYNYSPTILQEYTFTDFLKHRAIYPKALNQDQKAASDQSPSKKFKERQVNMQMITAAPLKEQLKRTQIRDWWYLVVDTKILLEDMFFVEKLVKSDRYCRLHLPYEVFHDLTALQCKKRPGWMRTPARRVVQFHGRLLKLGQGQGAIEAEDVYDNPVAFDSVINCCLQMMRRYYYVVLITDDPGRKIRAASVDLPCFDLQETKELTATDKLTVTISNMF